MFKRNVRYFLQDFKILTNLFPMKKIILLLSFILVIQNSQAQSTLAEPILLWSEGAPGATGNSDEDKPAIIPFVPEAAKQNGTAILVIPGGGFTIRSVDHEGVLVAQWLKEQGITAFLLRYRLRPLYDRSDWFSDGSRAMQYIRAYAEEYHIDLERVGAVGFSAGANLVADLGFNATNGNPKDNDVLGRQSSIPNFDILAYGAMPFPADISPERLKQVPPTFMFGTIEDGGSLRGMNALFTEMAAHKIPVETHFFQNGVHGSGFAVGDPILGEWPHLLRNWMHTNGFLSSKERLPLNGFVKLDGKPLLRGMIVLTPEDDPNDPPVIVYMTNTGTGPLGRFEVPAGQGPVAGKYKVEVRQEATRWTSNSRDPFMINMMAKMRADSLTQEDRLEWGAYLRKRNLNPSIDNSRLFSKQKPSDTSDYTVDIKPDEEVLIEVFSE